MTRPRGPIWSGNAQDGQPPAVLALSGTVDEVLRAIVTGSICGEALLFAGIKEAEELEAASHEVIIATQAALNLRFPEKYPAGAKRATDWPTMRAADRWFRALRDCIDKAEAAVSQDAKTLDAGVALVVEGKAWMTLHCDIVHAR